MQLEELYAKLGGDYRKLMMVYNHNTYTLNKDLNNFFYHLEQNFNEACDPIILGQYKDAYYKMRALEQETIVLEINYLARYVAKVGKDLKSMCELRDTMPRGTVACSREQLLKDCQILKAAYDNTVEVIAQYFKSNPDLETTRTERRRKSFSND